VNIGIITRGGHAPAGANRVALELAIALQNREGSAVKFYSYYPSPEARNGAVIRPSDWASRIQRHIDWRFEGLGVTRRFVWELPSLRDLRALGCDVLHFHDVFQCTSPLLLKALSCHRPVCLTVHDCSFFTGGCLYPVDCRRFEKSCGQCPQREKLGRFDFTAANIKLRRQVAGSGNIHFVFPSRWIQSEAEKSLPIKGRSHLIPNGFDPVPYMVPSRHEARKRLGLLPEDRIVLMGAHSLSNPYKGASFALQALRAVADLDPVALVVGNPSPEVREVLRSMRILAPGFVSEKACLANYYAAADLLLFPSMADNLPIMIQESMAAATPVLAFRTGGIPEMIDHGETGWLVERGNQEALDALLRTILVEGVPERIGMAAKDVIQRRFPMTEFVERHLGLYREIEGAR
jgi:glycosyltransferase involved in cell wall biosynthesis